MAYSNLRLYRNPPYQHSQYTGSVLETARDKCIVNYACSGDDARLVDAPGENNKRVGWALDMIEWGYDDDVGSMDVLPELLEGKDEDVWLWVDGDELNLPEHPNTHRLHQLEEVVALQRRRQAMQAMPRLESHSNAQMRQRVQTQTPIVRLAAIAWLVISSQAMKRRDNDYGLADRIKWDLYESIFRWSMIVCRISDDLPEVSASYLEEFKAAMVAYGHSCHEISRHSVLVRWLYIQNVLLGEQSGKAVNFMHRSGQLCKACLD